MMFKLKLAKRKVELQLLQVNYVSKGLNAERTKEQKEVLKYLFLHPGYMFSMKRLLKSHKHAKYLNILTANSNRDNLYNLTKNGLKNV